MKHGFYRRLIEVDILILLGGIPFFILHFVSVNLRYEGFALPLAMLFIAIFIAFLTNSKLFDLLQSRFPALKRYVIRLLLVGFLFGMFASSDVSFDGDLQSNIQNYFLAGNLVFACLFIVVAKFAAMLGV